MESIKVQMGEAVPALPAPEIKVYRRRWVILTLFLLTLLFNCVPWMQYTVLAHVVTKYYGVSHELVEWTALVYNMTAMVLVLPAAFALDKYGLRPCTLIGAGGTALGLWLKVLGCWPNHFWAVLAGNGVVSIATNFIVSAPPRVAAVWFPADEVSSAVGASIIAQMGGISIGCLLAPLTASDTWTDEENFQGFLTLNASLAVLATLLLVAVVILFQQAPKHPPSPAQAAARVAVPAGNYLQSVWRICKIGPSFLLLVISLNLIISVYMAVTTVLNRDITIFFPDRAGETGYMATIICLTGMVASFVFGVLLDKTKKFKELSSLCYLGALISFCGYSVIIATASMELLYVVAGIFGIFTTSYFVPAYEWAVEITYPEPEGNPTSLLNWVMQPTSMVITLVYSRVFDAYGPHVAHGMLVGLMVVGFLAQILIPRRYKRLEAELALAKAKEGALKAEDRPLLNLERADKS